MTNVIGRERELSFAEEFFDCAGERFAVLLLEGVRSLLTEVASRAPECVARCPRCDGRRQRELAPHVAYRRKRHAIAADAARPVSAGAVG